MASDNGDSVARVVGVIVKWGNMVELSARDDAHCVSVALSSASSSSMTDDFETLVLRTGVMISRIPPESAVYGVLEVCDFAQKRRTARERATDGQTHARTLASTCYNACTQAIGGIIETLSWLCGQAGRSTDMSFEPACIADFGFYHVLSRCVSCLQQKLAQIRIASLCLSFQYGCSCREILHERV
eukprot:1047675-Pleurochrysis_carterae.AAC.2